MLRDRESIAPIFFVSAKEYVRWGTLYQLFFVQSYNRRASAS